MISLKLVVIATDLSSASLHAVSYGCSLAARFGAGVHLLHIVSYPFTQFAELAQEDFGVTFEVCEQQYRETMEQRLNDVSVAPLTDESRVVRIAQSGFPVADIPAYAKDANADLLVLGTHGHTGLTHVLMGSVCEAVVRRTTCPVLTVRSP